MAQLCMLTSSHTSTLITQGLKEMYSSGTFLDLEIFDLSGGSLHAHSCVLAIISPVLKNHLNSAAGNKQRIQRLCFRDISVTEWRIILDFVYLGEVIITLEQIPRMTEIVTSLEIDELLELCKLSSDQAAPAPVESLLPPNPVIEHQQSGLHVDDHSAMQITAIESGRFPAPSLTPGRGTQCPYTKRGTLAKHRLTPMGTGTISGPYGTVQITTEELNTEDLLKRVNEAFFGKETDDGNVVPKKRKLDLEDTQSSQKQPNVKIKLEKTDVMEGDTEAEAEQYVYIPETGEVKALSSFDNVDDLLGKGDGKTMIKESQNVSKNVKSVVQSEDSVVEEEEDEQIAGNKSKKRLYKCVTCGLALPFGPKLKRHEKEHKINATGTGDKELFTCDKCDKAFLTERSLNFHIRMNCTPANSCEYCSEKFHFRYKLDAHIVSEHPEEAKGLFTAKVTCDFCDEEFASESLLSQHKGKAHRGWKNSKAEKEKTFKCTHCGEIFKKSFQLTQHVKYFHTPTECDYCGDVFDSRNEMIDHVNECDQAPPGAAATMVKKHKSTGNSGVRGRKPGGDAYHCPHCQKPFPSQSALVRHNEAEHGGKDMTFCTTCNKRFQSIRAFRTHMMRHFGIRPFKCDQCERYFVDDRDLSKHKSNAHGTERPYKCPHCDWAFKDVSALYGHAKRKHNVVLSRQKSRTPLQVDIDDDTLADKLLAECLYKHHDDPCICVLCNTKFQKRGNMYVHGKNRHKKDFRKMLHRIMKSRGLRFPAGNEMSAGVLRERGDVHTIEEEDPEGIEEMASIMMAAAAAQGAQGDTTEQVVMEGKDEATGHMTMITEVTVEELAAAASAQEEVKQQHIAEIVMLNCPLCGEPCMEKEGIIKHGKEAHDLDFMVFTDDMPVKTEAQDIAE